MRRMIVRFGICLALGVPGARAAAPDLWVEAGVEPASVPVNAQTTYVMRFGHAVDVRAPDLAAPPLRLAEVRPLGGMTSRELRRDGKRYRVLERRFAVLPFASGEMILQSAVTGTTPAALPQADAQGRFELPTKALTLRVTPAQVRPGAAWLPAINLQISSADATLTSLKVGEVWTRQILIEAEGVDGSVIPPLPAPNVAGWSIQSVAGEMGTREAAGQLIGYRRQTLRAQALHAGTLVFPALSMPWWRVSDGAWTSSALAAVSIEVGTDQPSDAGKERLPAPEAGASLNIIVGLALIAFVVVFAWSRRGIIVRQRWQNRRQLMRACRANDPSAARRALLIWASGRGINAAHLEDLIGWASAGHDRPLVSAIGALERACYGPAPAPWQGESLRCALPLLRIGRRQIAPSITKQH